MHRDNFWRRATPVRVVDGDTVDLVVDNGFYQHVHMRFRLLGVDTPELNARDLDERAQAVAAREFVRSWLAEHASHGVHHPAWPFFLRTEKADSFGRFLAHVVCAEDHDLATALIDAGLGVVA